MQHMLDPHVCVLSVLFFMSYQFQLREPAKCNVSDVAPQSICTNKCIYETRSIHRTKPVRATSPILTTATDRLYTISCRIVINMGRSCSELLAGGGLFILNGVDLIVGIALCIYSLDLISTCNTPMYLYVPLLAIGTILVVASIMSSCGLVYQECTVCVALSSSVLGWISLAELGLAVVILTQGGSIDKFLRNHSGELHLSGDALAQFERHKFYPAYALVALALMEALRQRYSTTLHRARLRRQHQYEMLA